MALQHSNKRSINLSLYMVYVPSHKVNYAAINVNTSSLSTTYDKTENLISIAVFTKSGQTSPNCTSSFIQSSHKYKNMVIRLLHVVINKSNRPSIYFSILKIYWNVQWILKCISLFKISFEYYREFFRKTFAIIFFYLISDKCIICIICNFHFIYIGTGKRVF